MRAAKENLDSKVRDCDQRIIESIAYLEDRVLDTEKKTLWRINDCEALLSQKVTESYVNDSLRGFEDKMKREVTKSV